VAERLAAVIKTEKWAQTDMIGPAPCFFGKVNDIYRWQVILRGLNPLSLVRNLRSQSISRVEVDPVSLL
jgi:primosomal protein N' (replication factor Y)